ncbi:L,D-transpeptidase [Streptomyces sp. NPDC004610]|uniref:L,D-transpeptidase n=1 Tax=unclassified Streptomyces TaxID=2593676 RepID=UPI0033B84F3B
MIPTAATAATAAEGGIGTGIGSGSASATDAVCATTTAPGPYHRQVEAHLGLPVDGRQSARDCTAITAFQLGHSIEPGRGSADLFTHRAVVWERALAEGDALKGCPDRRGVAVCIDQNRQILWVEDAGRVIFRPVPARTGMPGYATRNGRFGIFRREKEFWSTQFDGPMPFAQFFSGGQALHASYRPIFQDPPDITPPPPPPPCPSA